MDNGSLLDYLQQDHPQDLRMLLVSKFTVSSASVIQQSKVSDIVNGLCYLHKLGVVHGDIKGQNILVSEDRRALIFDFGTSGTVESSRSTSSPKGTWRWSAPEVCVDNGCFSPALPASDIWSFSCVCYEVSSFLHSLHSLGSQTPTRFLHVKCHFFNIFERNKS
ncbi:kinase-like protein [Macrolepiota fuliginosa MF-IS2]|uniref:Kinase-like protein n=1 Tax=Macrolepiota fuliginosa MF-IS2 TaxID=1400762 RepID=A0A9P5X9T1_9AGAR|nr:kinase-like protein [Macrolepiota fuliginosa MF-IS2]